MENNDALIKKLTHYGFTNEEIEKILDYQVTENEVIGTLTEYLLEEYYVIKTMYECNVDDLDKYFNNVIVDRLSNMAPTWYADRFYMSGLDIIRESYLEKQCRRFFNYYFIFPEDCELINNLSEDVFNTASSIALDKEISEKIEKEIKKLWMK